MAAGIDRRGFLAALGGIAAVPPSHAGRQVPVEGAVGDGVADDTAAIQAALDAAATGGGSVHLPAGRYRLTSPLRPASFVTLAGDGAATVLAPNASTARAAASLLPIISILPDVLCCRDVRPVRLMRLTGRQVRSL